MTTDTDDETTHLRALLAEQTARAERAEAEADHLNRLVIKARTDRDTAVTANAEMRAALGDWHGPTHADQRTPAEHVEGFMRSATSSAQRAVAREIRSLRLRVLTLEGSVTASAAIDREERRAAERELAIQTIRAEHAEAANAEMRAQVDLLCRAIRTGEAHGFPVELHGGLVDEAIHGEAALTRPDLGAGWASPEVVAKVRDAAIKCGDCVLCQGTAERHDDRCPVADLDALIKKGR